MNWHGGFILEGVVILWIAIHYPKETPCVIYKLLWEQNCQGHKSSISPYFHSRPRREHHCDILIRCRIEKETYNHERKRKQLIIQSEKKCCVLASVKIICFNPFSYSFSSLPLWAALWEAFKGKPHLHTTIVTRWLLESGSKERSTKERLI